MADIASGQDTDILSPIGQKTMAGSVAVTLASDQPAILTAQISATSQIWKAANFTTTQTGGAIWTPASGKKVAVTSLIVGAYGTTAARMILWFGATADTTYTAGTDQVLVAASFAPSATSKPGIVFTPAVPCFAAVADYVLRITTDAALSADITVYGYEI